MHEWAEVRRLYNLEQLSKSAIARRLGMSRPTVMRLLELPHPLRHERRLTGSKLDPHKEDEGPGVNGHRQLHTLGLPGHLDHVPVGVQALEADVALGVLVLDELDGVGHKADPKCPDLLGGVHIESEMREAERAIGRHNSAEGQGESLGISNDDDSVRVPTGGRWIEAEVGRKELDGPLLVAHRESQVIQPHTRMLLGRRRSVEEPSDVSGAGFSQGRRPKANETRPRA